MGRKSFAPTQEQRDQVEAFAGFGATQEDIAKLIGCSEPTLRKHFAVELQMGAVKANMRVADSLYQQAVGAPAVYDDDGNCLRKEQPRDKIAAIYWTKARMGWRDQDSGADKPGKKEQRGDAAKQAAKGRFAPAAPPKLVVNNGD